MTNFKNIQNHRVNFKQTLLKACICRKSLRMNLKQCIYYPEPEWSLVTPNRFQLSYRLSVRWVMCFRGFLFSYCYTYAYLLNYSRINMHLMKNQCYTGLWDSVDSITLYGIVLNRFSVEQFTSCTTTCT